MACPFLNGTSCYISDIFYKSHVAIGNARIAHATMSVLEVRVTHTGSPVARDNKKTQPEN